MEFAKALLQVGVGSVAAAVLSVLVFGHQNRVEREQRDRERRADIQKRAAEADAAMLAKRDELLKGTLKRITIAYNNTKRARRRMRALGRHHTGAATFVSHEAYDELMAELNDAQLELEVIKSDVKTSFLASPSASSLVSAVRSMESYLGELIEEYEDWRSHQPLNAQATNIQNVPRLQDFLGPSTGSNFASRFSEAHASARVAVRTDIMHPIQH
jgi:hypothetical protein